MAKETKRKCPQCKKMKFFRADQKTCGCQKPTQAPEGQLLHYKAKSKVLEKQLEKLLKDRATLEAIANEVRTAVEAATPYDRVVYEANLTETIVAPVIKASDWQIGEVVDEDETDGFGVFTHRLAEKRVFTLAQKLIDWTAMHRKSGFQIKELHVFSEADLVSGNIHYELEVTNEFPAPVAAVKAGFLMGEFVARLTPHFEAVHVHEVNFDNHGRFTRKNQMKQGGKNNWSYVAHAIANQYWQNYVNEGRVVVHQSETSKPIANVLGQRFLLAHGHHIMGQLGVPYYGMQRDKAREATKRMNMPADKKFNYISIGHWHVPAIIDGNILVNGNLPGTTEFDHMQGRHAAPAQVSFMVHPKHGIFNWTAWKL
jgi:hypothetical protein